MAEMLTCPTCQRQLHIPESYFGQLVECPDCQHRFLATPLATAVAAVPVSTLPVKLKLTISEPVGEEEQQHLPRRLDNEDDDFDGDYPRPRWRPRLEPHRAGLILTLGILSIFFFPLVFGSIAWIMGSADLKEIEAGRMDPTGESQTRAGRLLGLVMVILNFVTLILTLVGVFIFMAVVLLTMK